MRRKLIWWGLILAWCMFIFMQSANPGEKSSELSKGVMEAINRTVGIITGTDKAVVSEMVIRKTAHFTEYLILGFLLFNGLVNRNKLLKTAVIASVCGILFAISDEIHQFFVPERGPRVFDVFVDSMGLITGIFLVMIVMIRKKNANRE